MPWKIWTVVLALLAAAIFWFNQSNNTLEHSVNPASEADDKQSSKGTTQKKQNRKSSPTTRPSRNKAPEKTKTRAVAGRFVLAVSWQPGFCETRPRVAECQSQNDRRYDARNFSLHGLWPQPRSSIYCGVSSRLEKLDKSRRWKQLPKLVLATDLRASLNKIMPGTRSGLQRHQWIKHGSCYGNVSAQRYFRDSLNLINQINRSGLQKLFSGRIGKSVSISEIRRVFDRDFGRNSGRRIRMTCKNDGRRKIIIELKIALSGKITPDARLADLLANANATAPGCERGIVDPTGLQ